MVAADTVRGAEPAAPSLAIPAIASFPPSLHGLEVDQDMSPAAAPETAAPPNPPAGAGPADDGTAATGQEEERAELPAQALLPSGVGDAILRSLGGGMPVGQAEPAAGRVRDIPVAAAGQPGASRPRREEAGELRLTLRQDILPGVEILMQQDRGRISVVFVTDHPVSRALLSEGGAQLSSQLSAAFGVETVVAVQSSGQGTGDSGGHSSGQSPGQPAGTRGDGPPEDGRSRGHRQLSADLEDA